MYDGAISGNTSVQVAGGVSIMDGGTFDIHDGTISGNTATPLPDGWSSGGGVRVVSGTFTMHGGEISDNTAVTIPGGWTSGGGLMFVNTSTFTMHDGTISDNAASAGAGVFVDGSSAFTMHNGEIFGNTALIHAGGVRVDSGGVFQISNGVIHGSDANQSLRRNTAPSGAALWGMAEHGTFPAGAFSRTGYLITTNNTVEVANGVALQGGIPPGGQVIDLTPAAGNYLGVVTATGVPFALLITTDAGEFVELRIDSYSEVHGLDLMFGPHYLLPNIVDLHTAGRVTVGGTYTIAMEGRAAGLPEGYVRIAPWPAGSPGQPDAEDQGNRVALSTGALGFELEFEFTPQTGDDYGRVRILIADAATPLILTSVVIRNAGGDVVWSLAEALMSPL